MFSKSTLNEIRDRISIASLIGERIPLKKAGRNLKGLCPFHNEKTPSFNVNDEKGIYHCFGCGEGGDAFQFMMKFDGVSFSDAVRYLASKAGVQIKEAEPFERAQEEEAAKIRRMLLSINELARAHFQEALNDPTSGAHAREYLQHRGITKEFFTQHLLGFAEKGWDALAHTLEAKGVSLKLAAQLGLVKAREGGGYYDFFRNRLIFPIRSPRGETIGFGGRTLDDKQEGEKQAKYLNSPDSPVYHKSTSVYGLDRTAGAIRTRDQAVLVEGYMDFIALLQAGIENVAAPLGTALTQGHVSLLARYTRNMVLVFDGDEAGLRAAFRALSIFIEAGIMPRIVILPQGEDPDSVVRKEGAVVFRERIERARPLFEYFVEFTAEHTGVDSTGKSEALRKIVPFLRRVSDSVDAAILRQHVARRLDIDENVVARAIGSKDGASDEAVVSARQKNQEGEVRSAERSAELMLVKAMLMHPETIETVFEKAGPAHFCDEWCRTVVGLIMDAREESSEPNIREMIENISDEELAKQLRAIAVDSENEDEEDQKVEILVADCVEKLLSRPARARIEAINDDIRRAQNEGDEQRMMALLAEKNQLISRVRP
ncbi:MAG: DNA primase [Pseudomonadota bacterium]